MAGAPAAILKSEVILRVEAKYKIEQKARGLTRAALVSPILRFPLATHSSVLAWRIPGTAEPGGLPSMGSHRVRHD